MSQQEPPNKPPDKPAPPMDAKQPVKRKDASLGRDVQAKIGQQLRAYYDGLVEPTPDRFVDLLRQLEKPDDKGSKS